MKFFEALTKSGAALAIVATIFLTQRVFEIDVAGCVQLSPEAVATIFIGWPGAHNTMTAILSPSVALQYRVISNIENVGGNVYTKYGTGHK